MAHLTQRSATAASSPPAPAITRQGVAFSARKLGIRAVIVMPQTTPRIKVDAVRDMGAEVILVGDSYADAKAHCDTLVAQTGLTFIHPFDDPLVIAGQGTIAMRSCGTVRIGSPRSSIPVGGGGLIAGIAGLREGDQA